MTTDVEYPSEKYLSFLVCEDVRPEAGGKAALLGVFVGGDIVITGPADETAVSVVLLFSFADGHGSFRVSMQLVGPDGKMIVNETPGERLTKTHDANMSLLYGNKLLQKPALGTYTATVTLDERRYDRTFRIRSS